MTKRFKIIDTEYVGHMQGDCYIVSDGECEFRVWEDKKDVEEVVGLLNHLHEENEQLRILLKERQYEKDISKCKEENEQLKYDNEALKGVFESYCSISEHFQKELREENEQLRRDHKRQENQIKLLNKQLTKIPPKIREVWIE